MTYGFRSLALPICLRCAAFVTATFIVSLSCTAETQVVHLTEVFADFALHPETGDIAVVDPKGNTATLFRREFFTGDEKAMVGPLRVGSTPVSIVYKPYQDKEYFAVVCTQDSHMYVFDAKTFAAVKKIPLASAGVSLVSSSRNPADPFVYYNYGGGHDSVAGVVDVRTMTDRGVAFDDSMDCAISASGQVAYRRGPWSPSGFESLLMTSSFSDEKPVFTRIFYDHNSTAQYVPDALDQYTAAGSAVYTRELNKKVATLDFPILCFFKTKPVAMGLSGYDRYSSRSSNKTIRIQPASYNTFSKIGSPVEIPPVTEKRDTSLPPGLSGQGGYSRLGPRTRLIADDKRQQVIYANLDRIVFVPLADFDLPDEAFLQVTLSAPTTMTVGTKYAIKMKKMDPRIEVTFDNLPEGMKEVADGVEWTPGIEQVGLAQLTMNIKHGDIERQQRAEFDVSYPHVKLPFAALWMALSDDATRAVCWDGPARDRYERPSTSTQDESTVAVVDLVGRKVVSQKKVPFRIGPAAIDRHYAYVPSQQHNYVYVIKPDTFERVKMLYSNSPVTEITSIAGKTLVIRDKESSQRYSLPDLERLASSATSSAPGSKSVPAGLLIGGALYDASGETRKMIVGPGKMMSLPAGGTRISIRELGGTLPPGLSDTIRRPTVYHSTSSSGARFFGNADLADTPVHVKGESKTENVNVSTHTYRRQDEVALVLSDVVTGAPRKRLALFRTSSPVRSNKPMSATQLHSRGNVVVVLAGDRLFRWTPDGMDLSEFTVPLRFRFEQSAFAVPADGTAVLKHALEGGKKPFEYTLLNRSEYLEMDDKTGTVTMKAEPVLSKAETLVLGRFASRLSGTADPPVERLRQYAVDNMETATRMLGRKPTGIPVAVPVQLRATDAEAQTASLQYYLIAELPYQGLVKKIEDKVAELEAKRQELLAQREAARAEGSQPSTADGDGDLRSDVARLRDKVESLEARIDLLTREVMRLTKQKQDD